MIDQVENHGRRVLAILVVLGLALAILCAIVGEHGRENVLNLSVDVTQPLFGLLGTVLVMAEIGFQTPDAILRQSNFLGELLHQMLGALFIALRDIAACLSRDMAAGPA